jgi:hypothetical protein
MTEAKGLVIMPLGWQAGHPVPLADALTGLANEMSARKSEFLDMATDHSRSDMERVSLRRHALDLEKYATAINAIALQVDPDRWKQWDYSGLLELAKQNNIALPNWMTMDK